MPHRSRHTARIRALYETIDEVTKERGRAWYIQEHKEAARLAFDYGHSLRAFSACLAVLSPRCQWPRVKQSCRELLAGEMPAGLFGHNLAKARQILKTGNTDLIHPNRAPKTWAFWQNLWRPDDPEPVTLDSWMF